MWALYTYWHFRTIYSAATAFSVAFFFILFGQGQVLRIARNVRDEQNAEQWAQTLEALTKQLGDLHSAQRDLVVDPLALIAQAKTAIMKNRGTIGARLAAMSFGNAIRDAVVNLARISNAETSNAEIAEWTVGSMFHHVTPFLDYDERDVILRSVVLREVIVKSEEPLTDQFAESVVAQLEAGIHLAYVAVSRSKAGEQPFQRTPWAELDA